MSVDTLSAATRSLIEAQQARQTDIRRRIVDTYGSIDRYLGLAQTDCFDIETSPLTQPFYDLYERCFPLAEERETLAGFKTVLAFNRDATVQRAYGPIHEFIMVLRGAGSSDVVGAANFAVMPYTGQQRELFGFDGSCQLNFLCVEPDLRGVGLAQRLLDDVDAIVRRTVTERTGVADPRLFLTIEQNDPRPPRMTRQQIDTDAVAALIDPFDRLRWWAKRGYRKLEFAYVQPPLSAEHEACRYIDYFIRLPGTRDGATRAIPAAALLEHLRRFFFVSVGKQEIDMEHNTEWLAQKQFLEARAEVGILPANG